MGVGELKHVRTGWAAIANMTGRGLTMAIYVVRVATRIVNGDGCGELEGFKRTSCAISTDRRHHLGMFMIVRSRFSHWF